MFEDFNWIWFILMVLSLILCAGLIKFVIDFGRFRKLVSTIGEALSDGVLTNKEVARILAELADLFKKSKS